MHDQDVAEGIDVEETAQSEARPPDPPPEQPVGGGQSLRSPPAAHLHHPHPVALLGEPVGRHAAAEAGTDHDEVEVHYFLPGAAAQVARGTGSPHAGNPSGSLGISSPGFSTLSRIEVRECLRDFSGLIPISADPSARVMAPNSSLNVMVSASTKTPLDRKSTRLNSSH